MGPATLLVDVKFSSLAQPIGSVWLGMWHRWKLQSLDDLG
jgi:hypothetical protein